MTSIHQFALTAGITLAALAFVPGCASDSHPHDVPAGALLNTEGTGRLVFTAPAAGTVYVYDDTGERLLYSGQVTPGQRVVLDPSENRIDLDNRKVSEQSLGTENKYQIYFDTQTPVVHQRTVVEERVEHHVQ
jgi:hypothetical protein